jgi:hypothetical protein
LDPTAREPATVVGIVPPPADTDAADWDAADLPETDGGVVHGVRAYDTEVPVRRNLLRSPDFLLGIIVGGAAVFIGFGIFGLHGGGPVAAPEASPTATLTALVPTFSLSPTIAPTLPPTLAPIPTPSPTPDPTPSPTLPPTPPPTLPPVTASPVPVVTDGPDSHTDPQLEALLPDTIGGVALHRTSPSIAAQLDADPRAASALSLLRFIGKSSSDIHFARAVDDADPNLCSVYAFQVSGIDARLFGGAIANVVLSSVPGAQTSTVNLGGKSVTKAVSPTGGPNAYIYETGDTAFAIETTDESLAAEALGKLP